MAIIPVYPYGTDSEVQGVTTMRAFRVKMERGNLKNTGAMDNSISGFNNYIRSSMLIRTNDATKVTGKTLTGFTSTSCSIKEEPQRLVRHSTPTPATSKS